MHSSQTMIKYKAKKPEYEAVLGVAENALWISLTSIGLFLSVFSPTSSRFFLVSRENLWKCILLPLFSFMMLITLPIGILGLILRYVFYHFNHPYTYSIHKPRLKQYANTLTICTANVCLLPEFVARLNNMPCVSQRAKKIGMRITSDVCQAEECRKNNLDQHGQGFDGEDKYGYGLGKGDYFGEHSYESDKQCNLDNTDHISDIGCNLKHKHEKKSASFNHDILTTFPALDVICFQETWERDVSKVLLKEIHETFPYVIYDVGKMSLQNNCFLLNSGLMVASKYPIKDADYQLFRNSYWHCRLCGMGLLMVKVYLEEKMGKQAVGYIFNTHLQSFEGDSKVLEKQLDDIFQWTVQFKEKTAEANDSVKFDILCGDLNFDNMSPADARLWTHPLFDLYEDVAKTRPGEDESWTVGTELRPAFLQDELISTSEGLRNTLLSPQLRHQYLVDANIRTSTMSEICSTDLKLHTDDDDSKSSEAYQHVAGRRRIDYILYRRCHPIVVYDTSKSYDKKQIAVYLVHKVVAWQVVGIYGAIIHNRYSY